MRLDPEHVRVLSKALTIDPNTGKEYASFDIEFMTTALFRLNPWERGLFTKVLLKAALAKRKTKAQRAILALFVNREDSNA